MKHEAVTDFEKMQRGRKLREAIEGGWVDAAIELIGQGAQLDCYDKYGKCAIHLAVEGGYERVVQEILRRAPEEVHHLTREAQPKSPLYCAVNRHRLEIADLLLRHGADINALDTKGESVIFTAMTSGIPAMVQLLVDRDARLDVVNHTGLTVLATGRILLGNAKAVCQGHNNDRWRVKLREAFEEKVRIVGLALFARHFGAKGPALKKSVKLIRRINPPPANG